MQKICTILLALVASVTMARADVYSGTCGAQDDNLTWELSTETGVLTISGTGEMADREHNSGLWYDYREDIKSIIINDGVTSIGEHAFRECVNVTSAMMIPPSGPDDPHSAPRHHWRPGPGASYDPQGSVV